MKTRTIAALIIKEVINTQKPLNSALESAASRLDKQDRAFLYDLCYGVFRYQPALDACLKCLLKKPLKKKDDDIRALLWSGLYQIQYQQTPEHAAVSASVNACVELNKHWAKSLVNAILRKYIRQSDEISTHIRGIPSAQFAHPDWFIERLKKDWPDYWKTILAANQAQAAITLRVNTLRVSRQDYANKLQELGIEFSLLPDLPQAICLQRYVDVSTLPGYAEGLFSVQDGAAQFAAALLDLKKDQSILDACSAPGGKTSHILETEPGIKKLTALEIDHKRVKRLQENLYRLGHDHEIKLKTADAADPDSWWDGEPFDRILLDIPCSASGIIRRHPDIKYHRKAADISNISLIQRNILKRVWPLLKPGGKLLYVSCSVIRSENDEQIRNFIAETHDVEIEQADIPHGHALAQGTQILPGTLNMDGFYYARLVRLPTTEK